MPKGLYEFCLNMGLTPPPLNQTTARLVHWGIPYPATLCDQAFDIASCLLSLSKKMTKYARSKLNFGFRSKILVVIKMKVFKTEWKWSRTENLDQKKRYEGI